MKIAFRSLLGLHAIALVAVAAQQYRYFDTRRDVVADRQAIFHSPSVFHVATLLTLSADQELLSAVRAFANTSEDAGGQIIHAGKTTSNGPSDQVAQEPWDAFVLVQFATREAYDEAAFLPAYQAARARFASTYAHGMLRSVSMSLFIRIVLLEKRVMDYVTFTPNWYPFERAELPEDTPPERVAQRDEMLEGLLSNRAYGRDAVVILNFLQDGAADEREDMAGDGDAMFDLMAESGNGPMHFGRAVTVEGDADFDTCVIVYYPGVDYVSELAQSTYFLGIFSGKRLRDNLTLLGVPLLPHF